MKKFLKIFLIIFVICCILLISFLVRNYMIINKIYDLQKTTLSKIEISNNFLYERKSTSESGNVDIQVYYKDGIYKSITYFRGELDSIDYLNTNESTEPSEKDKFTDEIRNMMLIFASDDIKIRVPILQFIKSKNNQYIISIPKTKTDTDYYYINKENGMIEKWETDGCVFTFKMTENVVIDADIEKPESM